MNNWTELRPGQPHGWGYAGWHLKAMQATSLECFVRLVAAPTDMAERAAAACNSSDRLEVAQAHRRIASYVVQGLEVQALVGHHQPSSLTHQRRQLLSRAVKEYALPKVGQAAGVKHRLLYSALCNGLHSGMQG